MLPRCHPLGAAIKDRIVEALDQLYINGWAGNVFSSAQAARNLIDLATGATLGALQHAPPGCAAAAMPAQPGSAAGARGWPGRLGLCVSIVCPHPVISTTSSLTL